MLIRGSLLRTEVSRDEPDFRFSISELPRWAQKQLLTRPSVAAEVEKRERQPLPTSNTPIRVAGKWAEVCTYKFTHMLFNCICIHIYVQYTYSMYVYVSCTHVYVSYTSHVSTLLCTYIQCILSTHIKHYMLLLRYWCLSLSEGS